MAEINGIDSGLVVQSIQTVIKKPEKKKPSPTETQCKCCGFTFEGSVYQTKKIFVSGKYGETFCIACSSFFGMAGVAFGMSNGFTNLSYQDTEKKMKQIEDDKYVILLKTMNFGSEKSGINFTVDFGDIFKVKRIGTSGEPTGTREDVFKRFTIDIDVGVDVLTLYLHECAAVSWLDIMSFRGDKLYEEAYLCQEDSEGYFRPTEEGKNQIVNQFGDR